MTDNHLGGSRKPWSTPQLRRIDAGSAEARLPSGKNDVGGSGTTNKS